LRLIGAETTYHITARGNGRMVILGNDEDRRRFLSQLTVVSETHRLECHAYCLMHNHYHLVATTPRPNLSAAMQQLNGPYGRWWNQQRGRTGHVFQGRFFAQVVQRDSYLLSVCRYVVLNPVRAGLVHSPEDWPWSSYRSMVGLADPPPFLRSALVLRTLDSRSGDAARERFRNFVVASVAHSERPAREPILGDPAYRERFSAARREADGEVPRRERLSLPELDGFLAGAVTRPERDTRIVLANRLGHSMSAIARHLGLHPSTVSLIISRAGAEAGS
jgi:REP element-mobilizing transposase RayT